MNIEETIINKIDEVNKEYNIIIQGGDLDFICLCTHQKNAMIDILEEILNDVKKLPDYKSALNELFNFYAIDLKDMLKINQFPDVGKMVERV